MLFAVFFFWQTYFIKDVFIILTYFEKSGLDSLFELPLVEKQKPCLINLEINKGCSSQITEQTSIKYVLIYCIISEEAPYGQVLGGEGGYKNTSEELTACCKGRLKRIST